jgi:hypothetical protein
LAIILKSQFYFGIGGGPFGKLLCAFLNLRFLKIPIIKKIKPIKKHNRNKSVEMNNKDLSALSVRDSAIFQICLGNNSPIAIKTKPVGKSLDLFMFLSCIFLLSISKHNGQSLAAWRACSPDRNPCDLPSPLP